jgi:hypothetical protein
VKRPLVIGGLLIATAVVVFCVGAWFGAKTSAADQTRAIGKMLAEIQADLAASRLRHSLQLERSLVQGCAHTAIAMARMDVESQKGLLQQLMREHPSIRDGAEISSLGPELMSDIQTSKFATSWQLPRCAK